MSAIAAQLEYLSLKVRPLLPAPDVKARFKRRTVKVVQASKSRIGGFFRNFGKNVRLGARNFRRAQNVALLLLLQRLSQLSYIALLEYFSMFSGIPVPQSYYVLDLVCNVEDSLNMNSSVPVNNFVQDYTQRHAPGMALDAAYKMVCS
ncbi:hypothetical protein [Parendozoicomonas haliclonae]|uniref:Uncharacterized protein n=1 Tax=Parendozoicomonas haliclonae TaxID=1960125 RepID=A0A1X7AJQ5_9GAMM|nr:hypothetical protein [Parendozoicomonas haliclonae]SMA45902.1 hypothetical protein EHSB41UT_02028 [Parendozoicomonas haliclonae]